MSLIFVSYDPKDKNYVQKLSHALTEKGFNVWIDEHINYDANRAIEIERQLQNCSAFILVMSSNSEGSYDVQEQLRTARDLEKPILSLLLDGKAWFQLQEIQFVEVKGGILPMDPFFTNLASAAARYEAQARYSAEDLKRAERSIYITGPVIGSILTTGDQNDVKIDTMNFPNFKRRPRNSNSAKSSHTQNSEGYALYNYLDDNLLRSWIDIIKQKMHVYWQQSTRFKHFTYQGVAITTTTENIINQLVALLPEDALSQNEIFILLAACWLYEIGLQPPSYSAKGYGLPIEPDFQALEQIRQEKHLISEKIIHDALFDINYSGPTLGLEAAGKEYGGLVAKVCRWCSTKPENILDEDDSSIKLGTIKIKFLACMLQLADQLHLGPHRINWVYTKHMLISPSVKAKIWVSQFAQVIPFTDRKIKFRYSFPKNLAKSLSIDTFRNLIESDFKYETNPVLLYLVEHDLPLIPPTPKDYKESQASPWNLDATEIEIMEYLRMGIKIPEKADVLIITVTEIESRAVFNIFNPSREIIHKVFIGDKTYFYLGKITGTEVFMVQSEMGNMTVGGSMETTLEGINALSPKYVIMVGIAFGVDASKQSIGEILVSERILPYELQKIATKVDGKKRITPRGDRPHASQKLINTFKASVFEWNGAKPSFGLILSGEKLIDNIDFREEIKELEPEAIGGEMEANGVYLASYKKKVDWIVSKAICDWADGNKSDDKFERQKLAASNAVEFVYHVIRQGGLAN